MHIRSPFVAALLDLHAEGSLYDSADTDPLSEIDLVYHTSSFQVLAPCTCLCIG